MSKSKNSDEDESGLSFFETVIGLIVFVMLLPFLPSLLRSLVLPFLHLVGLFSD